MQPCNREATPEPEHLGSLVPLVGPMSVHPGQHPCQIPKSSYRDLMALIPSNQDYSSYQRGDPPPVTGAHLQWQYGRRAYRILNEDHLSWCLHMTH